MPICPHSNSTSGVGTSCPDFRTNFCFKPSTRPGDENGQDRKRHTYFVRRRRRRSRVPAAAAPISALAPCLPRPAPWTTTQQHTTCTPQSQSTEGIRKDPHRDGEGEAEKQPGRDRGRVETKSECRPVHSFARQHRFREEHFSSFEKACYSYFVFFLLTKCYYLKFDLLGP